MPTKEYSIVEQLKKTPAQISLMSLLMSSAIHRSALVKVLSEAYVPAETTSESFSAMVGQVLETNKVSFHDDELPPEGLGHNKALNIIIRCKDKFVSRVLIDNGSAVNICPFVTLQALGIDIGKMRESHVRVRGFDGMQRGVIGEINLPLQIGPEEFMVEFQVLDISTSYNLLLGRPWIHMAGVVPLTLHQTLKFVWNHQEIVVHGEGSDSVHPNNLIPMIESLEELDGFVFHTREIMCSAHVERVKLPRVLMMVAWEMLKNGFVPGQGLGVNLDGIVEPIQLLSQKHTFGLGYKPTPEEVSTVHLKRTSGISLPHPIPPLNQSFSKASVAQGSKEAIEDNLMEGFKSLFIKEAECNVISEDCTKTPTIWDAKPGDALNNWTCSPSLALRESW